MRFELHIVKLGSEFRMAIKIWTPFFAPLLSRSQSACHFQKSSRPLLTRMAHGICTSCPMPNTYNLYCKKKLPIGKSTHNLPPILNFLSSHIPIAHLRAQWEWRHPEWADTHERSDKTAGRRKSNNKQRQFCWDKKKALNLLFQTKKPNAPTLLCECCFSEKLSSIPLICMSSQGTPGGAFRVWYDFKRPLTTE